MNHIVIKVSNQSLAFYAGEKCLKIWRVSTAKAGIGQLKGSYQTPIGRHIIRAKIGEGAPEKGVFVGRRFTGEVWSPKLHQSAPDRDWILTRILWLSGCEPNRNRFGNCDSMRRYIYIHGTPEIYPMGQPLSHGCIRMHNADMVELFDLSSPRMSVSIEP